jgi:hypothetical protein
VASESVLLSSSVLAVGVKVPAQVMLSVLVITASVPLATVMSEALEKEATASEKTSVTVALSPALIAVSERVKELTEGAVVSTTNVLTLKVLLAFPAESVTIIVQFEYVPSLKETKVIVLLLVVAEVVLEEQEPPYVMVPASEDEKV